MPKFVEEALTKGTKAEQIADVLEIRLYNALLDREMAKLANNELLANLAVLESQIAQMQKPLLAKSSTEAKQQLDEAMAVFKQKYQIAGVEDVDWESAEIKTPTTTTSPAVQGTCSSPRTDRKGT